MHRSIFSRAALIGAFFVTTQSFAATTWSVDPSHTNVLFMVSHMVINKVNGWFAENDGTLTQPNDADFNGSSVVFHIKTASISTANDARDKHLRSADFFESEKYPIITFTSTSFRKTGGNEYAVTGSLDMHGVTKTVTLKATFGGFQKDMRGSMHAGFKATSTINRTEYNLKWNKALEAGGLLVGENVDLTFNVELVKQ